MTLLPLLLSALALSASPEVAAVETSSDQAAREAIARSLPYLEKGAASWREERKCVTCHRVAMDLWVHTESKLRNVSIDEAANDELTHWALEFCATDKNKEEPTGGFLHTMNQMILSQQGLPASKQAIDTFALFVPILARMQREDGSWREGNQIKVADAEREADEVDTMWTLWALGTLDPVLESLNLESRAAVAGCQKRALSWLENAQPGARTDSLMLRMLMAKRYGDGKNVEPLCQELLQQQRADGGWSFLKDAASHVHTTGECLYALSSIGLDCTHPAILKGRSFLISQQQPDGSWQVASRRAPDRTYDITNYWGTCWATIGLLRTLP